MKIRNGFVSNSSSCSFCIAKCYMTPEAIKDLQKLIRLSKEISTKAYPERSKKDEAYYNDEGTINETDLYFYGTVSQHFAALGKFGDRADIREFFSWGDE